MFLMFYLTLFIFVVLSIKIIFGGKMNKRLNSCPVCNSQLKIHRYHCPNCQTDIEGEFEIGELDALSPVQQEFVKIFVCREGNIKEVEKVMAISYPTVKNRLSEIKKFFVRSIKKKQNLK